MTRRDYEDLGDVELPPDVEAHVEAAIKQAEEDLSRADLGDPTVLPAALLTGATAFAGLGVAVPFLPWPFGVCVAAVNVALLLWLRAQVRDHLVARSLGFDVLVRGRRTVRVLRVAPQEDLPATGPATGDVA